MKNPWFPCGLRHESARDVPKQKNTIKGVPFVDTPRPEPGSPFEFIRVRRDEWEANIRAANAGRWGLAIAGLVVALAIIWVANIGS